MEYKNRKNIEKNMKNIWRLKKSAYLCNPFERKTLSDDNKKFIEKIEGKYKKQVPRKYNLSRSVNFFMEL